MSWSFTINDFDTFKPDSQEWKSVVERMMTQHLAYPHDMMVALDAARSAGLKSATMTGMRTPNPAGGPEVIDISIRGFAEPIDFNAMIKAILLTGTGGVNVVPTDTQSGGDGPVHNADDAG